MNSQEYLKSKINNLVIKYPSIKCSYAFDGFDNTHTIEITPSSFYNHDELFIQDESFLDYSQFVTVNSINSIKIETSTLVSHEFSFENPLLPFMSIDEISSFQNQLQNDLWENLKSNSNIGTNKFALAA